MVKLNKTNECSICKSRDFWLVMLVLVYGFYSGLFGDLLNYSINKEVSSEISKYRNIEISDAARIEIDYGTKRRAFEGDVLSDMSMLDALLAASRGGSFEVRYALLNDQTDIMKIEGLIEDGLDGQWHFYLNQKEIQADELHKVKIKPGDKIFVKFE